MKEFITAFFTRNLDIVFFIYGLAFVVMGIAIFTQPRRQSIFKLGPILWLLGAFGLVHGINEWLDMWVIIKGQNGTIDLIRWFCLIISFVFLLEFGRRIFRIATQSLNNWQSRIASYLGWWLTLTLVIAILMGGWMAADFWQMGSTLARYLLAFPSGLLVAAGFRAYYDSEHSILESLKMKGYFITAGVALLIYGFIGGLVVPKGDFFPADWLNNGSFLSYVGIPVQVFRAICAIATAWAMMRILTIFNWEITDKVQMALESQERVTEGIAESIMMLTPDLKILWANKTLRNSTHLTQEEIIGNFCYRVTHHLDRPCQPPHDICPVEEMMKTGKPVKVIHTHYDKEGAKLYNEVTAYPVRDAKGDIIQLVHVARDVSDKVKMERELTQVRSQLLQSQKMEAMGTLAGGIAHDFNNILASILGNTELLQMLPEEGSNEEELKNGLGAIKKSTNRATDLVKKILMFSRKQMAHMEPLEVNGAIKDIQPMLARILGENIKVELDLSQEDCFINADRGNIDQILLNLAVNARDAMPNGGQIIIKTKRCNVDAAGRAQLDNIGPGEYVQLSFEDTGCGIPKAIQDKVFDPFFTTKGKANSTGLGLSVVFGIIKTHKAGIHLYSEEGKGTGFHMYFPAIFKDNAAKIEPKQIKEHPGNNQKILVVEDEDSLRELVMTILNKKGYNTVGAANLNDAIQLYEENPAGFDLVFSDMILPDGIGLELLDKLNLIKPVKRVLLSSGYLDNQSRWEIIKKKNIPFLHKPYDISELLETIERILKT